MDRLRQLRLVCAVAGFALAVAGVVLEERRVVWVAIAVLAVAFLLRVYVRRRERDATDGSDDGDGDGDGDSSPTG